MPDSAGKALVRRLGTYNTSWERCYSHLATPHLGLS